MPGYFLDAREGKMQEKTKVPGMWVEVYFLPMMTLKWSHIRLMCMYSLSEVDHLQHI